MNQSSLFSFEESSDWDPKVIRKCLVVSQDQLIKLDSFPEWAKVQNNQDNLRLDKEFSIENSQAECSVYVVSNSQKIEKNRQLFNEQIEDRQAALKAFDTYGNKLTRSLSLFSVSDSHKNLLHTKTLKRASSFQNLFQLFDTSNTNHHSKDSRCENLKENLLDTCNRNIPLYKPIENINTSSECKISHSEPGKSNELFLSREINSETMEVVSQFPATVPNPIENASLHFETVKVSNGIVPSENATTALSDQLVKDVNKESVSDPLHSEIVEKSNGVVPVENAAVGSGQFAKLNTESVNADLPSEIKKDCNGTVPTLSLVPPSNDVTDEPAKAANSATSSSNKFNEDNIPVSSEICKPDSSIIKEVPHYVISAIEVSPSVDNISDESVKAVDSLTSSSSKSDEFHIPVSSEKCESDSISVKEVPANVVCENPTLYLNAQDKDKINSSNLCSSSNIIPDKSIDSEMISVENDATVTSAKSDGLNLHESCPSKSEVVVSPAKAIYVSEKGDILKTENLVKSVSPAKAIYVSEKGDILKTENLVKSSDSDMKEINVESEQKESGGKTCVPMKSSADNEASSGDNEAAFSKKRKLESRNKRSKRLKSEDKQSNIKIRSIKKVGEIRYNAEEVKTMLDIMRQFL